jgi:hypothetical protein
VPLADSIVTATWGLVVVTTLLVVASCVPVVLALRERWLALAEHSARVVPPLHILTSRVSGLADEIAVPKRANRVAAQEIEEQLEMLADILTDSPPLGVRFVSELFVARHLLTHAQSTCQRAWYEARSLEGGRPHELPALAALARAQLVGALTSIQAAERIVPRRKIGREDFWSRFNRLSDERVVVQDDR